MSGYPLLTLVCLGRSPLNFQYFLMGYQKMIYRVALANVCYIAKCRFTSAYMQHHNGTIMNRRRKTSLTKCVPLTLLQGFEKIIQGLRVRGSWRSNRTVIFWPQNYGRQRCVFLVLQGCSTGRPEAHSTGWWLSLLHLISNFSGPQLIRAPRPLRFDVAFPTTARLFPPPTLTGTLQGPQWPVRPGVAFLTTSRL